MRENNLTVYVFNIGAGDHILLEFPDKSIGIIDSFFQASHLDLQEVPALTYLKAMRSEKDERLDETPIVITFLCISHADLDHLTGLDMLLNYIEDKNNNIIVENLWLFGGKDVDEYFHQISSVLDECFKNSVAETKEELRPRIKNYKRRLERLKKFRNNWRETNVHGGYERYFDDIKELGKYGVSGNYEALSYGPISPVVVDNEDTNLRAVLKNLFERVQALQNELPPDDILKGKIPVKRNDVSAILAIKFGSYNLLFGGDATLEVWDATIKDIKKRRKRLLHPDFIKASHHGSKHSSSKELWKSILDKKKKNIYIGISAGKKYSHPHDEFYEDVMHFCTPLKIAAHFLRTNECIMCQRQEPEGEVVNWFENIKSVFDENYLKTVEDAMEREIYDIPSIPETKTTNLLAHIFVFPYDGDNNSIRVVRGTSAKIGAYSRCVFDQKSVCYCKG